jgi:hypothetical protein
MVVDIIGNVVLVDTIKEVLRTIASKLSKFDPTANSEAIQQFKKQGLRLEISLPTMGTSEMKN